MTVLTESYLIKMIREEYKKKINVFISEAGDEEKEESKKIVPVQLDDIAADTKIRHKSSGYLYTVKSIPSDNLGAEIIVYDQGKQGSVPSVLWVDREALEKDYVID